MITAFFVQLILIRKNFFTYTSIASSLTPVNIRWHQPIRTSQETARDTRLGLKSVTLKYGIETFVMNHDFNSRRHPVCHFTSVNFCNVVNEGDSILFWGFFFGRRVLFLFGFFLLQYHEKPLEIEKLSRYHTVYS